MKFARIVVLMFLCLVFNGLKAQIDYLSKAKAAFNDQRYYEAIDSYKKAYSKMNSSQTVERANAIYSIAECYRLSDNIKQSEVWYSKAIKASYEDPIAIYYLAESKKLQGKYEKALEDYDKFLAKSPSSKIGLKGKKSCELSLEWMENPTRIEAVNAPIINSSQNDYSPVFSDKKNEQLIFTSTREGSAGNTLHGRTGQNFPDLYVTKRDKKGKWSEPFPLTETVNSSGSEGSSCLNQRKNTIYFTRCPFVDDGVSGCQLFWAKKQGQNWAEPVMIPIIGAEDSNTVGHPAISPDDKILVFASDMPGGYGGKDLWYIKNLGRGKWSEPVNLGSAVNTAEDELFPYIGFDGTLYFSSLGHIGMGGLDIFKATDAGNNQWGSVENMKYPINSNAHDFGIVFDRDKPKGYLSSSRSGGQGGDDIWEFYLPALVFAIEGEVRDKKDKTKKIAGAKIQVKGSDGTIYETTTDGDGTFLLADNGADRVIKPNMSYSLLVSNEGYLNAKGDETTIGYEDSKVFYHVYELQPKAGPIKLPKINYAFGKWDLLPESKDSLNYLYDIMIDNPYIVIELSAHTDYIGSRAANQTLSQKRAQSCVNYLIERGIPGVRMKAKGYGEDRPLKGLEEDKLKAMSKEEDEIARAKNRRTEFRVLKEEYRPAGTGGN